MKSIYWWIAEKFQDAVDWFVLRYMNPFGVCPGGNCPVQAEGTLPTGEWYYFRARGEQCSVEISKTESDWWKSIYLFSKRERVFDWPEGGWISRAKACRLATGAIKEYYNNKKQ